MNSLLAFPLLLFGIVSGLGATTTDKTLSYSSKIVKFLQSIPASARTEMEAILNNKDLTRAQMEAELDKWATKQPGDFPAQYAEIKAMLNSDAKPAAGKVPTAAEQEIYNIKHNTTLTRLEERKAILDVLARESPEEELNFAFPDNLEI